MGRLIGRLNGMKNRTRIFAIFFAGIVDQGFAASEFENGMAPAELVTEFSGGGSVYRSLPDGLPVAPTLAGLPVTIVGSIERAGVYHQVLFRSPLASEELRATLLAAYAADGWIDISSGSELGVCRDDKGQIYFRFTQESAATKVALIHAVPRTIQSPFTPDCAQTKQIIDAQKNGIGVYPIPGLQPQLTLPPGAIQQGPGIGFVRGGGYSSSSLGTRYETSVDNNFKLANHSLGQLFQHLASQLQAQGWQVDSDSVGSRSAVSAWFKTLSYTALDGKTYEVKAHGFLKLVKDGTEDYELRMSLEGWVPLVIPGPIVRPAL